MARKPSMKKHRKATLARLIVTLALGAASGPAAAAPWNPGVAHAVGPCATGQICTFHGPEDIVDLAGTPWLLISQQEPKDASIGLAALNTDTGEIIRYDPAGFPASCVDNARGGGIGLRAEAGGYRLVRLVHAGGLGAAISHPTIADGVETYRVAITAGRPVLTRTACVQAPVDYFLNDIAALADGGFAATHMYDRSGDAAAREAKFLASQPTGFVVRWSPKSGWSQIPNSEGSFPNGIDASPDGRWIAFAETYGHVISRIGVDGSGRERIPLAMNPDNVTALADGRFVVAGGTGEPLVSTRGCGPFSKAGCGFPAAAMVVDFAKGSVTPIVTSGGDTAPGFSVAVIKAGKAYIGSSSGDRVTVVTLGAEPVALP
jgi:sugar lactone lactonase YvrE